MPPPCMPRHARGSPRSLRANRSSTKKKKIEARGRARAAQSFILDWPRASPSSPRKGRAYDVTRRPFETLDRPLAANPFRTRAEETTTINDGGSGAKTHDGYNVGEWGFFFSTLFHTNGFRPRRAYPPLRTGLWSDFEEGARQCEGKQGWLSCVAAMPDRFQGTSGLFGLNKVE